MGGINRRWPGVGWSARRSGATDHAATAGPQGPILIADTTLADPVDLSNFLNAFTNQTVRNPKVRRWDQSGTQVSSTAPGGDVKIQEGVWIDLENGIQVFYQPGGNYLTGDHWLIPARMVTGEMSTGRGTAPAIRSRRRRKAAAITIVAWVSSISAPRRGPWPAIADRFSLHWPMEEFISRKCI